MKTENEKERTRNKRALSEWTILEKGRHAKSDEPPPSSSIRKKNKLPKGAYG